MFEDDYIFDENYINLNNNELTSDEVIAILTNFSNNILNGNKWCRVTTEDILPHIHTKNSDLLGGIVRHFATPPDVLRELAQTEDCKILIPIAAHKEVTEDVLEKLSHHSNDQVVCEVAKNTNTSYETLKFLIKTRDEPEIIKNIAINRGATSEILNLIKDIPYAKGSILANTQTDPQVLIEKVFSKDFDEMDAFSLSLNKEIPYVIMRHLALHENDKIRYHFSGAPYLPLEILLYFAVDNDFEVREKVAYHSNIPPMILELLAQDSHPLVRSSVIDNENCPIHLHYRLFRDPDTNVVRKLLSTKKCPEELLDNYAKNGTDAIIRYIVTQNPNSSKETLQYLIDNDSDEGIIKSARFYNRARETVSALDSPMKEHKRYIIISNDLVSSNTFLRVLWRHHRQ